LRKRKTFRHDISKLMQVEDKWREAKSFKQGSNVAIDGKTRCGAGRPFQMRGSEMPMKNGLK